MRLNATAQVNELRQGIADELASIASPLMTRLAKVDELIAERLEDLKALREVRAEIVEAVRPIVGEESIPLEPGRNAKAGPKPSYSKGKRGMHTRVSPAKVDAALAWMREQNGNEFTSKDVETGLAISDSSANAIMLILREREQIRVTREHHGPRNPRRYKVVG